MATRLLVLVKHGFPILDPATPAREWSLSPRGETQALLLAEELRPYEPFQLVSSSEPKARGTAELVASVLRTPNRVVDDLREIDRPALPIMEPTAHRALNRPIFSERNRAVLGFESADAAMDRFQAAIQGETDRCIPANLVAICHGTVIALFVAQHNPVDGFRFWSGFECGKYVALALPSFQLVKTNAILRESIA